LLLDYFNIGGYGMLIRPYHLVLAVTICLSLISIVLLPVMAKDFSIFPQTTRDILPALANTAWPMFQHDLQHTGRSPYVGPQTANLKWIFTLDAGATNSPAMASDGTLYVCASNGGQRLYAVNPDGTEKWSNPTWHSMNSTPAVGSDGTIYVVQSDDLAAYYPDHTHKWSYAVPNFIYSHPSIGPDGTIYFTAADKLYAIKDNVNSAGHIWIKTVPGTFTESSPAIATSGPNSGTIYVGTWDYLYAFTSTGDPKWSYNIVSRLHSTSPAIGADGTIYINSGNGGLIAITDTGSAGVDKWEFDMAGGRCQASPAIGSDGTIYIGNNTASPNSRFWAITDNGTDASVKWVRNDIGPTDASAVIGADSTVYFQNRDGWFFALNGANGTTKWSYNLGSFGITAAAIDAGGCVYVGTQQLGLPSRGRLYAFAPPAPTISSITPVQGTQGQTLTVVISGTNFYGSPTVSFSGAGIIVNSVTMNSLTQLTVNITITDTSAVGSRDLIVTTGGGTATKTGCFTVNLALTPIPTLPNPLIGTGAPTSHGASVSGPISPAPPVSLPSLVIQSASLSAKAVTPGTPIIVTADIANKSAVNGNKKVTLYINGQVETTQGITVNSGGSTKLTFHVSRSEPGDYTVYVDGVPAGSFKVEMVTGPDSILIFSAILVALAFIVGMVMLWRRQRAV
jgi:outer membrane protein assembly factor BamB